MKKWITYARTVWHEFWMYYLVGPATPEAKEEGLAARPGAQELLYDVPRAGLYIQNAVPKEEPKAQEPLKGNATVASSGYLTNLMNDAVTAKPTFTFGPTVNPGNKLWVYNASRVDHKVEHPMLGKVTIPANTTKKRYSMWTSFPEVVMGLNWSPYDNELYPCHYSGEDFVKDLINPDYIKGGGLPTSSGRDLSVKGVFWSYNNPPKAAEVNSAIQKMRSRYADLLDRIVIVWESVQINGEWVDKYMKEHKCGLADAANARRFFMISCEITPEHHAAADYFKVTTPWHPVLRG